MTGFLMVGQFLPVCAPPSVISRMIAALAGTMATISGTGAGAIGHLLTEVLL